MFCSKCGKSIPDTAKFCAYCGNRTEVLPMIAEEEPAESLVQTEETIVAPVMQEELSIQPENSFDVKQELIPEAVQADNPKPRKERRSISRKSWILGFAVVLAVVIAAVVLLKMLPGGDNVIFAVSGNKYLWIRNDDVENAVNFASYRSDNTTPILQFSKDGKYVYYFSKTEVQGGTIYGTLCCAEYKELLKATDKNDDAVMIVARNVQYPFSVLEGGQVVYLDQENVLHLYADGESYELDSIQGDIYTSVFGQIPGYLIYVSPRNNGMLNLYAVSLKNPDDVTKLASNVTALEGIYEDTILYTSTEPLRDDVPAAEMPAEETAGFSIDWAESGIELWRVGLDYDPEMLYEDVTMLNAFDTKRYFLAPGETSISCLSFVEDSLAASDAALKEPNLDDYTVPVYSYTMISGSNLKESNYDELFTTCTKRLYWYGMSTIWCYSMEDAMGCTFTKNTEEIHKATQKFIDTYGDTADADGFIPVTEDVKAALQEIHTYDDKPDQTWRWLWLCYTRKQTGTKTDYDAYSADYEIWSQAQYRNSIREALKSDSGQYPLSSLYCCDNGEIKLIAEAVVDADYRNGAILYKTAEQISGTVTIEDFTNVKSEIENILSISDETDAWMVHPSQNTSLYLNAQDIVRESGEGSLTDASFYASDDTVYMHIGTSGVLAAAPIEKGTIGEFTEIDTANRVFFLKNNVLYYGVTADGYYIDLYTYANGNSNRLAKHILLYYSQLYEDGTVLGYDGNDLFQSDGYEMRLFDADGNSKRIADQVTSFSRQEDGSILYISDGDLFRYTDGEKSRILRDVAQFWIRDKMEPVSLMSMFYLD